MTAEKCEKKTKRKTIELLPSDRQPHPLDENTSLFSFFLLLSLEGCGAGGSAVVASLQYAPYMALGEASIDLNPIKD